MKETSSVSCRLPALPLVPSASPAAGEQGREGRGGEGVELHPWPLVQCSCLKIELPSLEPVNQRGAIVTFGSAIGSVTGVQMPVQILRAAMAPLAQIAIAVNLRATVHWRNHDPRAFALKVLRQNKSASIWQVIGCCLGALLHFRSAHGQGYGMQRRSHEHGM